MKLIHLNKTLPDGRVAAFHRALELVLDAGSTAAVVLVGSWVSEADAAQANRPDGTSRVELPEDTEATRDLEVIDRLAALPGWNTGELVELRSR